MLLALSIQRSMARESDPNPFGILATKQDTLSTDVIRIGTLGRAQFISHI